MSAVPIPDPKPTKGYTAPIAWAILGALAFCLGFTVACVAIWFGNAPKDVALFAVNKGTQFAGLEIGSAARPRSSFMPIALVVSTVVAVLGAFSLTMSVIWASIRYQPRRRVARAWRNRPGAPPVLEPAPAAAALNTASKSAAPAIAIPPGMTTGDPLDFAPPET
jgi:hypothetical protein